MAKNNFKQQTKPNEQNISERDNEREREREREKEREREREKKVRVDIVMIDRSWSSSINTLGHTMALFSHF